MLGIGLIHLETLRVTRGIISRTHYLNNFIDTATGGSIDGMIAASGTALAVMDSETQVIPGHGSLSDREDLRRYRDALKAMRDAVADLMEEGRSLEQIVAARPIRAQAEAWGQSEAAEASFVATIHHGVGGH